MTYKEAVRYYRVAEKHLGNPVFDTSQEHSEMIWPEQGDWLLHDPDGRRVASVMHVERAPWAYAVTTEHDGKRVYVGITEEGRVVGAGEIQVAQPDELDQFKLRSE